MASETGLKMSQSNQIDTYRRICSETTIQSDPDGHFAKIVEQLREKSNYPNDLLQVSLLTDNLDVIKYVASLEALYFSPRPVFKAKDEAEAIKQRTLGNEAFAKRDLQKAFLHYTVSVIKAEHPLIGEKASSTTLSFALGNRSACLLSLGHYKEAAADINLALSAGYPDDGRYKLYERLARIYLKMGLAPRARTSVMIAQQLISKSETLDENKKTELKSSLDKLAKECAEIKQEQKIQSDQPEQNDELINSSDGYPAMSTKTNVAYRQNYGRHVVATENVSVGETILVEEPHAAVLFPEKSGFNCSHCFKRFKAAIPCTRCSGIAFCSPACRDEALATYHNYECSYQDVLSGLGCSHVVRLALRMITQKPYEYFLERKSNILKIDENTQIQAKEIDPYLRSIGLVGLNDLRWPEDKLLRAVMALVLVGILRASGYFGEKKATTSGSSLTPNEMFIASLILRNMQILQFNAHEVYEVLRAKEESVKPCKNIPIGLAIYPTAAYFNHSCHGNVTRFFKGSKLYIKTLHSIKSGEEISENYGPTFYLKNRNARQNELSGRYWFQCSCKPCTQNWPLLDSLPTTGGNIEQLKVVDELMAEGKLSEAIVELSEMLEPCRKDDLPSQTLIRAEDKLRTCISNLGSVTVAEKKK